MKFHIPSPLREFTGGRSTVEIDDSPATVTEALSALWKCYPGLRDRIATEQGQIREHINVFVGDENIQFTGGLATPVGKGSEISIVPNISGGSHFEPIRKLSADYTDYSDSLQEWKSLAPFRKRNLRNLCNLRIN